MKRPVDHSGREVRELVRTDDPGLRARYRQVMRHHRYWIHERAVDRDAWKHEHPYEWLWHEFMWRVGWRIATWWVYVVLLRRDPERSRRAGIEGTRWRWRYLIGKWT